MITLPYWVDMCPDKKNHIVARLSQNDEDFTLIFHLYASEGEFALASGTTATMRGTLTNGDQVEVDGVIDTAEKTVTVNGSSAITAAAGHNVFEIGLTSGGKNLYSENFDIWVERAPLGL